MPGRIQMRVTDLKQTASEAMVQRDSNLKQMTQQEDERIKEGGVGTPEEGKRTSSKIKEGAQTILNQAGRQSGHLLTRQHVQT